MMMHAWGGGVEKLMDEEILNDIIGAASVMKADGSAKQGLYCLGPFAARVSFISQQYRALNLVWALTHKGLVKRDQKVAVIGAGLAGVTAAMALIAMGCKVKLYDMRNGVMARQRHTNHRIVHPNVNRWPMHSLNPSTDLPFLNWFGAKAGTIFRAVRDEWKRVATEENQAWGVEVIEINERAMGGLFLTTTSPAANGDFDAVILAVGFGDEIQADGFDPVDYWRDDLIEDDRTSRPNSVFIVSGCGDGGLIDALRLVHFGFDKGRLVLDTAEALTGSPIAEMIEAAETSQQRTPASLAECYKACGTLLVTDARYADVDRRLTASLRESMTTVRLIDENLPAPYSPAAAPIHKLMVAHARARDAIFFSNATAARVGSEPDIRRRSIMVGEDPFDADTKVIVRHGANAKFGRLLTVAEQDRLKSRRAFGDQQAVQRWAGAYPVPDGFPEVDPLAAEFLKDRLDLAIKAVRTLDPTAVVSRREGYFEIVYRKPEPVRFPEKLFGVRATAQRLPLEQYH